MGLLEKRAAKEFEDGRYADLVKKINSVAGYDISIDVKWDSLAKADHTHLYEEGFTKVYFTPIVNALKEITQDDLGKEALKETLKKIVIKNEAGIYSVQQAYTFSDGTLTIDHEPFTNMDNIDERSKALVDFLSSKL